MKWFSYIYLSIYLSIYLANAGDAGGMGLIPGLTRISGGGNANPLQYSFLENPMDRGAWWATVPEVEESQAGLRD